MGPDEESSLAELIGRVEILQAELDKAVRQCAEIKRRLTLKHKEPGRCDGKFPVAMIAKLLMIDERRVQQLVADGWIPRVERGRYGLIQAVQGYIAFLTPRNAAGYRVPSGPLRETQPTKEQGVTTRQRPAQRECARE